MNGAEKLCRILYGRKPEIADTIGGLDAQMLTDAAVVLEALLAASVERVIPQLTESAVVCIPVSAWLAAWPKGVAMADETDGSETCICLRCIDEKKLTATAFDSVPLNYTRMIVCGLCGNKRCPRASDHRLECAGSNSAGQEGSVYR
jgi:hypothetical protein